ncbi:DUF6262 family protein [Mycobacterium sp. pUA109]|uniref:DUF6262 family protein n=1 Tax=Mycobacterium sp. pUA109 TaxID=3238982 RepID=UPI00351B4052
MTVTRASLAALEAATQIRRDSVDTRALKALKELRREKAPISISSVARRARVTRKSIHRRPALLAKIETHRTVTATPAQDPPASGSGESSIIAALRNRLVAKDTQIAELRAALRERDRTIAVLHGELERYSAGG